MPLSRGVVGRKGQGIRLIGVSVPRQREGICRWLRGMRREDRAATRQRWGMRLAERFPGPRRHARRLSKARSERQPLLPGLDGRVSDRVFEPGDSALGFSSLEPVVDLGLAHVDLSEQVLQAQRTARRKGLQPPDEDLIEAEAIEGQRRLGFLLGRGNRWGLAGRSGIGRLSRHQGADHQISRWQPARSLPDQGRVS
jgi:hypothetical protein